MGIHVIIIIFLAALFIFTKAAISINVFGFNKLYVGFLQSPRHIMGVSINCGFYTSIEQTLFSLNVARNLYTCCS